MEREWDLPPGLADDLRAVLSRSFTVDAERPSTVVRTFLDTFDWRLHAAGVRLEVIRQRGNTRLELHPSGGRMVATVELEPGAAPPARASDLEPESIREYVAPLADDRALLPLGRLASKTQRLRVLDGNAKTVSRVTVERSTDLDRAIVVPVRGYEDHARTVGRALAAAGAQPAAVSLLAVACRATGRAPGDYSSKLLVDLTDELPADVALARVLLHLLDTMERNEAGLREDTDDEFLHDFRIAVRRTRSLLKAGRGLLPDDLSANAGVEWRRMGDVTGPPRDLDVLKATIIELVKSGTVPPSVEAVVPRIERRRTQARRRMVQALDGDQWSTLRRQWRAELVRIHQGPGRGASAGEHGRASIARADRRVLKRGTAIDELAPAEQLHDLRKDAKQLRYLLEGFRSLLPAKEATRAIEDLKDLQDVLGRFYDAAAHRLLLHDIVLGPGRALSDEALVAAGQAEAALERSEAEARESFGTHFAAFAAPATRQHFAKLTRDGKR